MGRTRRVKGKTRRGKAHLNQTTAVTINTTTTIMTVAQNHDFTSSSRLTSSTFAAIWYGELGLHSDFQRSSSDVVSFFDVFNSRRINVQLSQAVFLQPLGLSFNVLMRP